MNNYIYSVPSSYDADQAKGRIKEKSGNIHLESSIEKKFTTKLCELLSEVLDITHKERRLIEPLIYNSLKNEISNRNNVNNPGLLEQYLACKLEILSNGFQQDLCIKEEDINIVNHNYDINSKFCNISNYIRHNYVNIKDINSDGTFETLIEVSSKTHNLCGDMCCEPEVPSNGPCDEEIDLRNEDCNSGMGC